MPGKNAIQVGTTGRTVAGNLARLRKARGMTIRALSVAVTEAGRALGPDAIAQIENAGKDDWTGHARRVDVDDLVALAVVLGVSPSSLLLPPVDGPGDMVEVTGAGEVPAAGAWDWVDGRRPLVASGPGDEDMAHAQLVFALYARPSARRGKMIAPR